MGVTLATMFSGVFLLENSFIMGIKIHQIDGKSFPHILVGMFVSHGNEKLTNFLD